MLTSISGGGRRLKRRRLLASRQDTANLFTDMERHYDALVGVDLPIPNNPGSQLQIQHDADSFTATITNAQGHVINQFEAFYIEQDEYDEPCYDIYINDQAEENATSSDVEYAFTDWITSIRRLIGVVDEESEWELLNNGDVNPFNRLDVKIRMLRDEFQGMLDSKPARDKYLKEINATVLTETLFFPYIQEWLLEYGTANGRIIYKTIELKTKHYKNDSLFLSFKADGISAHFDYDLVWMVNTRLREYVFLGTVQVSMTSEEVAEKLANDVYRWVKSTLNKKFKKKNPPMTPIV